MEAARAMAQGIENADHDAEVRCLPMADGGEGTARALVDATGGSMHAVPVHDPLGRPVEGHFGKYRHARRGRDSRSQRTSTA